jgi:hypothetical protein
MAQSSLRQELAHEAPTAPHVGRSQLLDKIISTQDVILEFDPVTGELKEWGWYILSRCNNGITKLTD